MQIISLTFPDKYRATQILADLADLEIDWGVPVDEAVVAITKSKHGKVRIHQTHEASSAGAWIGGTTGFLTGLLLLAPVTGAAIGAAAGAALGSAGDPAPIEGIDKKFLKQLGSGLMGSSSALIAVVPDRKLEEALGALKAYDDGAWFHTVIDAETEQAIQTAFDKRKKA